MSPVARLFAAAGMSGSVYAFVLRPRLLRSGATGEEVDGPFPGADLLPGAKREATMAVRVDAHAAHVWPWLVQMGCGRAGWYSWERLDNGGAQSAWRIHPEWQELSRQLANLKRRVESSPHNTDDRTTTVTIGGGATA
jgi:hypothetical protein